MLTGQQIAHLREMQSLMRAIPRTFQMTTVVSGSGSLVKDHVCGAAMCILGFSAAASDSFRDEGYGPYLPGSGEEQGQMMGIINDDASHELFFGLGFSLFSADSSGVSNPEDTENAIQMLDDAIEYGWPEALRIQCERADVHIIEVFEYADQPYDSGESE